MVEHNLMNKIKPSAVVKLYNNITHDHDHNHREEKLVKAIIGFSRRTFVGPFTCIRQTNMDIFSSNIVR